MPLPNNVWKLWLPLAAFAVLWLDLIRQLSYTWDTNEQYAYGWFVPLLALGLFLRRWTTRPSLGPTSDLQPPTSGSPSSAVCAPQSLGPLVPSPLVSTPTSDLRPPTSPPTPPSSGSCRFSAFNFLLSAFPFLLCLALLPLRLILEINQDWSLFSGLLTLSVVAISLYVVFLMGGWPWVRHFAFPVCFILVAVRWPYWIEHTLTLRLMKYAAAATVNLLGLLNIPAVQHGNLIEVATGTVGVDEACSGIRSFQSTVMAGLFLGELYLLRWNRRLLLVAVGIPVAFSLNVARTTFLSAQAAASGLGAVDKWHDSAGMAIFLFTFACLFLLAYLVKGREAQEETKGPRDQGEKQKAESRKLKAEMGGQAKGITGPQAEDAGQELKAESRSETAGLQGKSQVSAFSFQLSVFPASFLLLVGLWSLCVAGLTEFWYRAHENHSAPIVLWSAQYPADSPSARKNSISETVKRALKCDEGHAFSWTEPDGSQWSAFGFRWRAGEATSRMAARDHRPEYCLGAEGHILKADLGVRYLPARGLDLPFRAYIFEAAGRPLYVFFCLWEYGATRQPGLGRSKYLDRLYSVLAGRRRLGQQTFEIVVNGYAGMEEAEQAVRQRLPSLVQIEALPDRISKQ